MKNKTIPEGTVEEHIRICTYIRFSSYGLISNADKAVAIQKYYNHLASEHRSWEIVDSFIDEGKSTIGFKAMIKSAMTGAYDIIITPSFVRLNSPPIDIAETVKELKALEHPVGIYFEIEQVFTLEDTAQDKLDLMMLFTNWERENKTRAMMWKRKIKDVSRKDGGI